jgi:hypothetical protein
MKSKPFTFNIFRKSIVQRQQRPTKALRRRQIYAYGNCHNFNGNFSEWSSSIQFFNNTVHSLADFCPLLKNFNIYLLNCLSGEPLILVKALTLSEENYPIDKFTENRSALLALKLSYSLEDSMWVQLLLEKLEPETRKQFEAEIRSLGPAEVPKYAQLDEFIEGLKI